MQQRSHINRLPACRTFFGAHGNAKSAGGLAKSGVDWLRVSVVEGLSGGKEWGVSFRGVGLGLRVGGVLQGLKDPPKAEA